VLAHGPTRIHSTSLNQQGGSSATGVEGRAPGKARIHTKRNTSLFPISSVFPAARKESVAFDIWPSDNFVWSLLCAAFTYIQPIGPTDSCSLAGSACRANPPLVTLLCPYSLSSLYGKHRLSVWEGNSWKKERRKLRTMPSCVKEQKIDTDQHRQLIPSDSTSSLTSPRKHLVCLAPCLVTGLPRLCWLDLAPTLAPVNRPPTTADNALRIDAGGRWWAGETEVL